MTHAREECEKTLRVYLLAARGIKLGEIDATIKAARAHGAIAPENIQHADAARNRCLRLIERAYGKGTDSAEFELAMEAGQTLFEIANRLHVDLLRHPLHDAHRRVKAGGRKGVEIKKQQAAGNELRSRIAAAIKQYKGEPRAMASVLARKFGCSATYVRQIKRETALR